MQLSQQIDLRLLSWRNVYFHTYSFKILETLEFNLLCIQIIFEVVLILRAFFCITLRFFFINFYLLCKTLTVWIIKKFMVQVANNFWLQALQHKIIKKKCDFTNFLINLTNVVNFCSWLSWYFSFKVLWLSSSFVEFCIKRFWREESQQFYSVSFFIDLLHRNFVIITCFRFSSHSGDRFLTCSENVNKFRNAKKTEADFGFKTVLILIPNCLQFWSAIPDFCKYWTFNSWNKCNLILLSLVTFFKCFTSTHTFYSKFELRFFLAILLLFDSTHF